jgi:endonuclease YncB( thermonuclease family)
MKYLKLFPAALFILLLTQAAFPQSKFSGEVVDVLDGKTVVIQTVGGKMTAALQYIEVPEREQPLYRTVAEHLRKLVINKRVEFRAQRVSTEVIVGQLVMEGTDLSQQMLRDGAAWHMGRDKTGQGVSEWTAYAENQSKARAEKLGVWSVPGLKPAWEFRAEKEEALRQKALAELPPPVVVEANPVDQTKTPMRRWKPEEVLKATAGYNPWPDINKDQRDPSTGIATQYDPAQKFGTIETPGTFLNMQGPAGTQRVETRSLYVYFGGENNTSVGGYGIGFATSSKDGVFQKSPNLTLLADGKKKFDVKVMKLITKKVGDITYELLLYKLEADAMQEIAYADKLEVKIGAYSGAIDGEARNSMRHLMLARK